MTSPGLVALFFALCFGGGGCKGLDGGNLLSIGSPRRK